jgi:hypothetical protein
MTYGSDIEDLAKDLGNRKISFSLSNILINLKQILPFTLLGSILTRATAENVPVLTHDDKLISSEYNTTSKELIVQCKDIFLILFKKIIPTNYYPSVVIDQNGNLDISLLHKDDSSDFISITTIPNVSSLCTEMTKAFETTTSSQNQELSMLQTIIKYLNELPIGVKAVITVGSMLTFFGGGFLTYYLCTTKLEIKDNETNPLQNVITDNKYNQLNTDTTDNIYEDPDITLNNTTVLTGEND